MIDIIENRNIDREAYEQVIQHSDILPVNAEPWFLDIICPAWKLIVWDDYKAVMPVVWNRKFGIPYVYLPPFSYSVGIYSPYDVSVDVVREFVGVLWRHFRKIDLNLHPGIDPPNHCSIKMNKQELHLGLPYQHLFERFSKSTRKNIRSAGKKDIRIVESVDVEQHLTLTMSTLKGRGVKIKKRFQDQFVHVMNQAARLDQLKGYTAFVNGQPLASAMFLMNSRKAQIFTAATSDAKKAGAVYLMADLFIKQHAGQKKILDFAGSNIEGVAYRNRGFGAEDKSYRKLVKKLF